MGERTGPRVFQILWSYVLGCGVERDYTYAKPLFRRPWLSLSQNVVTLPCTLARGGLVLLTTHEMKRHYFGIILQLLWNIVIFATMMTPLTSAHVIINHVVKVSRNAHLDNFFSFYFFLLSHVCCCLPYRQNRYSSLPTLMHAFLGMSTALQGTRNMV